MSLVDTLRPQAVPSLDPGYEAKSGSHSAPDMFSPQKHLNYLAPPRILSMGDLKLDGMSPISSFAATEPFDLLTNEAVLAHRRELFSTDVLDNCYFPTTAGSAAMLRGMSPKYAPFIHSFWNSPEILKIVSDLAGIELVPVMDYEVAHTNVQLGSKGVAGMRDTPEAPPTISTSQGKTVTSEDAAPASELVNWHKDSYAFVCVVMLSDARGMEGGETVLRTGDGSAISVRAPQMGGAVLLQGRYIEHVALPATNMPERITVVTSFRPRNSLLRDENSMLNVRTESQLPEMFYQWTKYRLANLAERTQDKLATLERRYVDNVKTEGRGGPGMCRLDTVSYDEMKLWVDEQVQFLQQTLHEIRPIDEKDP